MAAEGQYALDKLSLCWGSMDGVALRDFLTSASLAGFRYVTLNPAQCLEARRDGLSEVDLRDLLTEHGLEVSNIDPLFNWIPGAPQLEGEDVIAVCSRVAAADVFHFAQTVGADLVNAPLGFATPESEAEIVDCFGSLCDAAAQAGLRVSLEFMPFTQVPDLATAHRIVAAVNRFNGGIMFDCWHHHRSGGTPRDILAIPGERIFAVQLDDALAQPMDDMIEETLNHRRLPGEGCIDLAGTFGALREIGAQFICDVEVFDEQLRDKDALFRAQRMYATSAQLLQCC